MPVPFVREFDDLAEAIAAPPPNRPIAKAIGEFGRRVCDGISANPGLYAPTILQSPLVAACTPYWDDQGYSAPEDAVPFTGGQCPGIVYELRGEQYRPIQGNYGPSERVGGANESIRGPITSIEQVEGADCNISGFDAKIIQIVVQSSFGNGLTLSFNAGCQGGPQGGPFGFRNLRPVRQDGATDECGDPPGEVGPGPNPAPNPGPLPPGTGPIIDIRGNPILVLPESIEISPGLTVNLPIGEIAVGGGGGGTSAPGAPVAPDDEIPGEGSGGGGGDNPFGEPPPGERWVGACVTITSRPAGHGSIPQAEPESIFPDIIGNVRLFFRTQQQQAEYDTPLINKSKTLCVWEPVRGMQPIGVRVNLRPGFGYSYRPYSVPDSN